MSLFRNQIDEIKSKLKLSDELSKHIKIIHKGNDIWCLCCFHSEKTPSMKINDELSSYYCFGCGSKGDLITFYTDYLNYSFNDALKELASKAGIKLNYEQNDSIKNNKKIIEIFDVAATWFHDNLYLNENKKILEYLKKRNLSQDTIKEFKIGFSANKNKSLYEYLKNKSYLDSDIIDTNLFKINSKKKVRDFFYKRIIFPIKDINSRVIGFGGRSIDNSEPKYINSPESILFKKGRILYNLNEAKKIARKKNNLLICEGYMDVIALSDKGIKSVVAPLGTAVTYDQLMLAWKVCKSPTIMFDGDIAGQKASIKSALLALKYLKPNFTLKFLEIDKNHDPDSFINYLNKNEFINFLKKPKDLSNFIFDNAKKSFYHATPDQKIVFDKYFDDITDLIEDKKVKYFYKRDFKDKLFSFFGKNRKKENILDERKIKEKITNLSKKELLSFIAAFVNHKSIRLDLVEDLLKLDYKDSYIAECFNDISQQDKLDLEPKELIASSIKENTHKILKKSLDIGIYQLFPYSSPNYNAQDALKDVKKTLKIIQTRLSNSAKLDKSLKDFKFEKTPMKWSELKELSYDYISEIDF